MEERPDLELSVERFRAELDVFSGPLDLLLHLVKQEEVDIREVQLSRVTDRYLAAIRTMQFFDVNLAAEFLVVAATLLEIKSRTLLPQPPAEDEADETDAGTELIRRLLEYKDVKEAAEELGERAREWGQRFSRPPAVSSFSEAAEDAEGALLEDVAAWDLMVAFAQLLEQTRLTGQTAIVRSELPLSAYIDEVLATLRAAEGPVHFLDFFRHDCSRARIVGIFLAVLELLRRKAIHVLEGTRTGTAAEIALRVASGHAAAQTFEGASGV